MVDHNSINPSESEDGQFRYLPCCLGTKSVSGLGKARCHRITDIGNGHISRKVRDL